MTTRGMTLACLVAVTVVLVTIGLGQANGDSESAAAGVGGTSAGSATSKASPLTIKVGKAFELSGLKYRDEWYVVANRSRKLEIVDLKVFNIGKRKATHGFEMTFTRGGKVVASAACITALLPPDKMDRVKCGSGDTWPRKYDKVTVHQVF